MKNLILIFSILLSLTCCSDDDNSKLKTVDFTLIGQGELSGNGAENISQSNLTINDLNTWNELMIKMNSINDVTDNFKETELDFNQYQIIAIFDQIYGNGGHSIDVTNIFEKKNNLIVKIENLKNGDDTQVVTQPFHIIKIIKTEKQIIFE